MYLHDVFLNSWLSFGNLLITHYKVAVLHRYIYVSDQQGNTKGTFVTFLSFVNATLIT